MSRTSSATILGFAIAMALIVYHEAARQLDRPDTDPAVAPFKRIGYDPSRAPNAAQDDCRSKGKEYIAWRDDAPGSLWAYDCVDADLRLHLEGPLVLGGRQQEGGRERERRSREAAPHHR